MALEDTVIPLGDGMMTAKGEHISHLPIRKGQIVSLGIASYQQFVSYCQRDPDPINSFFVLIRRLKSRWGQDADEFKPSRWLNGGASKGEAVGPYANL
jgi:hypothetical protein